MKLRIKNLIFLGFAVLFNFNCYANNHFELPVEGSTGYAVSNIKFTEQDTEKTSIIPAGTAYLITGEKENNFIIDYDNKVGQVSKTYTMINLPDVIPSIIYRDLNSTNSLFKSSGKDLKDVTGESLYNTWKFNKRLGYYEFMMPVLYEMAEKISNIQYDCRENGDSLVLYQGFRPYDAQMRVSNSLQNLAASDSVVNKNLTNYGFHLGWFIAKKLSSHQRGSAVDVSLAHNILYRNYEVNNYNFERAIGYEEYKMPSAMHELSTAAIAFDRPVNSNNDTEWRKAKLASTMTESAIKLQKYCTDEKLSPLVSEWWHFNDLQAKNNTKDNPGLGRFEITDLYSEMPERVELKMNGQ